MLSRFDLGLIVRDLLSPGDPMHAKAGEIGQASHRAATLARHLSVFSRKQTLEPSVVPRTAAGSGIETLLGRVVGEDIRLSVRATAPRGRTSC